MKGSGKTFFSKELLSNLMKLFTTSRVYILDIKLRDFNTEPFLSASIMQDNAPPPLTGNNMIQVWQPVVEKPEEIEKWLWNVLHDPPALLYVDELSALCYSKTQTSEQYRRIQKLGRALPVGTITCTQELVDIPRNAIGQADHVARFRLKHPYERSLMANIMGLDRDTPEPEDKFGFWYGKGDNTAPVYFPDVQTFLYGRKSERR